MKRAMAGICLAAVLTAVACLSTGCYGTLYVSFDAGEYGAIVGDYTQSVPNHNDIVYPEVEAEAGYVFVGFRPTVTEMPKSGKVTIKAQYQRAEFRLINRETDKLWEDGDRIMIPTWGPNGSQALMPKMEATITDMQSEETATEVFEIKETLEEYSLSSVKFKFLSVENEYVSFYKNTMGVKDSSRFDWEATVEINVQCCGKNYYKFKDFDTKRFDIGMGHTRVTEVKLGFYGIWLNNKIYRDRVAQSGSTVLLENKLTLEDGSSHDSAAPVYVIKRIWSINGDEIAPEDFELYASYVSRDAAPEINENHIQLTDRVGNGWRIDVVAFYERDEVTSNVYTIEVF